MRAIHQHAGGQGEQNVGDDFGRPQEPNLEGRNMQDEKGGERQGELRDGASEVADRLRQPEEEEIAVAPDAAAHQRTLPQDAKAN